MRPTATTPATTAGTAPAATRERPGHWRPDIEGLRAVAVGVVIAAHIGFPYSAGGFVGVDVFFVISGFLITSLLLREIDRTGKVSLTGFYARRAVRLLPAAATVMLATLVAAWVWLPRTRLGDIAADAAAASLNVINIRLAYVSTDYFNADAPPSPLQHFWSLAVEEQFYLAWPLILIAVAFLTARLYRGEFVPKAQIRTRRLGAVATLLVLVAAGSFALSATQTATDPTWSYFGIHTRAWELAVGALIAVGAARLRRTPAPLAAIASWAGLALIVASVFVLDENSVFPGYAAALPVAGSALVIAAGCAPHRGGAGMLLGIAPAQYIGKISYGLYLWHWPVLLIAPAVLGMEEPQLRYRIGFMVAAFLLSVATFHLVENPVRTRRPLVQIPSRALALGGALMVCTLAASFVAVLQPAQVTDGEAAEEVSGAGATVWQLIDESVGVDAVPANLDPSLDEAPEDVPSYYAENCFTGQENTTVKDHCWFGDPEGEKDLILFGDSHAAQWFPPLNELAEASGWRMLVLTKSGCSIPDVSEYSGTLDREYTECAQWRDAALDHMAELAPDMIVATSSDKKKVLEDDPDTAWVEGWETSLDRLHEASDEVYILADTPWAAGNVPDCLASNPDDASACVNTLDAGISHPERREGALEAAAESGATVVDPVPWICDMEAGKCPVVVGNLLVYRDDSHLTATFASHLAPQLAAAIPLQGNPSGETAEAG
ncbi:acyltransferase family protein [Glycomyces paridis]|uniref:Acyltransferase n=1 Tax=Glycomyces paridis TaxID=2126555 RepID=A0A4S8P531_9ACTN|nr:acyltransferase family protein [Glycomyces paridis]THV22839.1 acyltransferase [Glycomyces paridis]